MKKFFSLFVLSLISLSVGFAGNKKPKVIDHYYVDEHNMETEYNSALFEIKVMQDNDSIVVCKWWFQSEIPVSLETFRVLNDSVQEKWGTQISYYVSGSVHRYQFIDPVLGTDTSVTYSEDGTKESEAIINHVNGEATIQSWHPSGAKKSLTKRYRTANQESISDLVSWYENGNVAREQYTVNHLTRKMKMYDEDGRVCLSIPCAQGDTIFLNSKGHIASPKIAQMYGVVNLDGDSIKINVYSRAGRLLSEENYMRYTIEDPVAWGLQRYYYTTTPQPVDSLVIFQGVNGVNLIEKQFYNDGKKKSITTVIYDKVMRATKELRQYFQSGQLCRFQKHVGDELVDGHCYDRDGKEVTFFEFKE